MSLMLTGHQVGGIILGLGLLVLLVLFLGAYTGRSHDLPCLSLSTQLGHGHDTRPAGLPCTGRLGHRGDHRATDPADGRRWQW
jgi:hypothetical protein